MANNGKKWDEISLGAWVTQAAANPLWPPLGSALLPKPSSGWVGKSYNKLLFWGFSVPDVCEPASQLLSAQLANRLFAQKASL